MADELCAGGLAGFVDGQFGCGAHHELHVVLVSVGGAHLIRDIVDGCREQVVVVDEHGRGEYHVEFHGAADEGIVGVGGHHADALLLSVEQVAALALDVLKQSEVGVSPSRGVVAMGSDDIRALVEQLFQRAVEMQAHTLSPRLARVGHLLSVDVELEHVVVRVYQVEVLVEVGLRQVEGASHIQVAVLLVPSGAHVVQAVAAPCCLSLLPSLRCEGRLGPVGACLPLAGIVARPCLFVGHGYDSLQASAVGSHPAVCLTVHAQQSLEGLLVVGPVAGCAIGQMVVGRPDAEVGVAHHERHRWQP